MAEETAIGQLTREELVSRLKSIGVDVDALLTLLPVSTVELRDMLRGLLKLGIHNVPQCES